MLLHLCTSCMEYWVLKWEILWEGWVQCDCPKRKKYKHLKLNNSPFYSSCCQSTTDKSLYWCLPTTAMEHTLSNIRNFDVIQFFKNVIFSFFFFFCQKESMSQLVFLNGPTTPIMQICADWIQGPSEDCSHFLVKDGSKTVINKALGLLVYTVWVIKLKT